MTMNGAAAPVVRVFSASKFGHAHKIAGRIADRMTESGCAVTWTRLGERPVGADDLKPAALVLLVSSIRYGYHQRSVGPFLAAYKALADAPPLAVSTVCLTARKPNRRTATDNPYLRKLIARHRLSPVRACAFAGLLDYPRYNWLDRVMVQFIMTVMKGPNDGTSRVEFTDWEQVERFADELATVAKGRQAEAQPL